jgi:hypothetical protein
MKVKEQTILLNGFQLNYVEGADNGHERLIIWRDLSAQSYTHEQMSEALNDSPPMHPRDGRRVPLLDVFGEAHGIYLSCNASYFF